ncbi:MAG: hypothetical protein LBG10_09520 [Treponema sp.]|nr:hypothetical protein [Treponema sp.]
MKENRIHPNGEIFQNISVFLKKTDDYMPARGDGRRISCKTTAKPKKAEEVKFLRNPLDILCRMLTIVLDE